MSGFDEPPRAPPSFPPSAPTPPVPSAPPPGAYPAPPVIHYHYAQPGRTSGLAIASMVLGILWIYWIGSILAVIFGHIAISQASKDPALRGKGMAIAGLVLGYVGIGILAFIIIIAAAVSAN